MIRTALVAAVTAAVVAAGWGCTQSPGSLAAGGRSPSARLAQMEDEVASLKQAQARLAAESAATVASLKAEREKTVGLTKERDELRADVATRQAERDAARARLDGFKTELRELLARVEGGAPTPSATVLGTGGF